ncbi:histidinol-phosphate transaminase [Dasania marina]|uniref:histidinol-phosphate transaminase n=1 Tax=Dasania marina TaxID=471499 RepID=UPI0030DCEE66|tara:strand:+ start:16728 stop:17831 length:1104 start_codon:yes stop_codon:yes gene_type:complete
MKKISGLRSQVYNVKPYSAGKFVEQVMSELGLTDVIKIASNENPYGPFPESLKAMQEELQNLNLYPDANFETLRTILGEMSGLSMEWVTLSHGAEAMLQTIAKMFVAEGDEVIMPSVSYALYADISRIMGGKVVNVPMTADYRTDINGIINAITADTKLLWLANPNNPTGTVFSKDELDQLMTVLPERAWVVMDEAYVEFADSSSLPDTIALIKEGRNILSTRTFSKMYGLAGARIGYVIANPELINTINTVVEPFNANRVATAGAIAVLTKDEQAVQECRTKIIKGRQQIETELAAMGMNVISSSANFVFFETQHNADSLCQKMMENGVILRSGSIWGCDKAVRVTIGTQQEIDRFLKVIQEFTNS